MVDPGDVNDPARGNTYFADVPPDDPPRHGSTLPEFPRYDAPPGWVYELDTLTQCAEEGPDDGEACEVPCACGLETGHDHVYDHQCHWCGRTWKTKPPREPTVTPVHPVPVGLAAYARTLEDAVAELTSNDPTTGLIIYVSRVHRAAILVREVARRLDELAELIREER